MRESARAPDGAPITADDGYDIVDFAWAASPFPVSADQPDYTSTGGDDIGGYANRSVDGWMAEAAATADPAVSLADLDRADRQISQDACTLPLYQLPTLIAVQPDLVNAHGNGTASGPTDNVGEWGLKKAS
ncbi:MAG TPA: hypothetical protein VGX23_35310 [Actinocrinis sp.]|nr:hypothetical protein [Actinocrinis sp.]